MSSIGKITEDIINRSPFLSESLSEGLINVSALARKIKPEIQEKMNKPVKTGAVVMAIKRIDPAYYQYVDLEMKRFMATLGDFLVRSDLEDYTFENSNSLIQKQGELMKLISDSNDPFYTFCNGVNESTIITSASINSRLKEIFKNESLLAHGTDLASITIKLPKINIEISGIYYYLLKHLAWEGINVVEVISTTNEFTAVVKSDDIDAAFSILMSLKKKSVNFLEAANNVEK